METVNFIEAVNSGKPFRCKDMANNCFYMVASDCIKDMMDTEGVIHLTDIIEMVNSEWFLKEEEILLTEKKVRKAIEHHLDARQSKKDLIIKELGFNNEQ